MIINEKEEEEEVVVGDSIRVSIERKILIFYLW